MSRPASNLGRTGLRHRRRVGDPMRAFDALPPELRRWLADAALPWSPASCQRLWDRTRASGGGIDEAITRLDRAERAALENAGPRSSQTTPGRAFRPEAPK